MTRREFLATSAVVGGALTMNARTAELGEAESGPRFPIIGFSKPFQNLSAEETAELVAAVGWDGIECPVRAGGQIEPARVTEDLPRFVEVLRRHKLDVLLVATDITSMKTPHAEDVLRTMARLGIRRLRLGPLSYRRGEWPPARLKEIAPGLRDVAEACGELGLQAGFQNHSGRQSVGAPVWDVFSILRDLDPRRIGFCFDIGHATVEGGLSWPTEARLAEPFLTAVIVKDFLWKKETSGWRPAWCPLGDGMIGRAFFDWLKTTGYRGPISQHHEYELGEGDARRAHFRNDLKVLREWLRG